MGYYCAEMGPYILCDKTTEKSDDIAYECPKGCDNDTRATGVVYKFCRHCGSEIESSPIVVEYEVGLEDLKEDGHPELENLLEQYPESLPDDKMLIVPCEEIEGGQRWYTSGVYEGELMDISNLDPQKEIKLFKTQFKEAIASMRKIFPNVEICYGLYSYYN